LSHLATQKNKNSITKFDGGCRDSFQFVKFFDGVLEKEAISSIINLRLSPNIHHPPPDLLLIKATHKQIIAAARATFDIHTFIKQTELTAYSTAVRSILAQENVLTQQQIRDQIDALGVKPELPQWIQPTTQYTPHVAAQHESYKKELRRQDVMASKALSLLKDLCAYSALEELSYDDYGEQHDTDAYIYPPEHDYIAMSAKGARLPSNDNGTQLTDEEDDDCNGITDCVACANGSPESIADLDADANSFAGAD
jgi:hypothetical protein